MTQEQENPEEFAETQTPPEEEAAATEQGPEAAEGGAPEQPSYEEMKDKLLRTMADLENTRRRAEREKMDAARYGIASFARDILTVADNLRRSLEAMPEQQEADPAVTALVEGVTLTEAELLKTLQRHGVETITPSCGEKFDHNLHQAMMEVDTADHAPGTVVEAFQTGYRIHDRLLRPAMVSVAKGRAEPAMSQKIDTKV